MYGRGVYFTIDFCKAARHADEAYDAGRYCIIVSRVVLGHPYMATGPMKTHDRLPRIDNRDRLHDSTMACRGIPTGLHKSKHQVHIEMVVPEGSQALPEFLVWLKKDG